MYSSEYKGTFPSINMCLFIYSMDTYMYILCAYYVRKITFNPVFFQIEQNRRTEISFLPNLFLRNRSWFLPRYLWIIQRNFLCIPEGNIWDKRSDRKTAQRKFFVSPFSAFQDIWACWQMPKDCLSWRSRQSI